MLFTRKKRAPAVGCSEWWWDLDRPLLHFSRHDAWSIRDAMEGTLIFGATGSGKTSGSGAAIAYAFLQCGMGGLVLTAKSDERPLWEKYCERADRLDDLRIFGPREALRFNFLDYEASRPGAGGGLAENVVNLLCNVLEVAERGGTNGGGREDESFWKRATRQLLRNTTELLLLARQPLSVPNVYRVIISAPTKPDQLASKSWQEQSTCYRCMKLAQANAKTPREKRDLDLVLDYFTLELVSLSEKTRSVFVAGFTSMADVLNRGLLRELLSAETNITPEEIEEGKIILLDLPVKEFAEVGQFAQVLFKIAFQKAVERRDVTKSPRPVFLWADEAQHFITSFDSGFQTTCRAARVATVLLSQNVSNFYAALGNGETGSAAADSLFGNLNTKFFHSNGDPITNEWASSLIGRSRQVLANAGSSRQSDWWSVMTGFGEQGQNSAGLSEVFEHEVQPGAFTKLRTGGPRNDGRVDAIVVRNGRLFRQTGRVWLPVTLTQ